MKYAWIQEHQDSYPVQTMCCLLGVSRSGFYRWLDATPSPRAIRSETIKATVRRVFEASRGIYGSKKIAHKLQKSTEVEKACRNTVAKAMKEMSLKSRIYRRFRPTTTVADPSKQPAANLLNQEFQAARPNQKWVADITYLPTSSGWVYLAAVLDLFSRKVVGWSMSNSLATEVITAAMRKAIQARRPSAGTLLHHSDRGCQYTSESFQDLLRTLQITCSMSRTGCCYDNAFAERFFWSLKHEWTKFESYEDLDDAKISVFKYIETFYNPVRLHQTLEYQSPDQFERKQKMPSVA